MSKRAGFGNETPGTLETPCQTFQHDALTRSAPLKLRRNGSFEALLRFSEAPKERRRPAFFPKTTYFLKHHVAIEPMREMLRRYHPRELAFADLRKIPESPGGLA